MGSLFRSEDMALCQIYLQSEAAYQCVSELGELGIVQFKDLNSEVNAFQKKFVNEVRRTEEMKRQLRYFERELDKSKIPIFDNGGNPEAPAPRDMVDLEATYEKLEGELRELNNSIEALQRNQTELRELRHVLQHTDDFLREASVDLELGSFQQSAPSSLVSPDHQDSSLQGRFHLGYVTGVIERSRMQGFNRLLWFACRGNVYVRQAEINEVLYDSHTKEPMNKLVFMVFFQGEQLKTRVRKICEGFKATLYPCPETIEERREMSLGVLTRLQDLEMVLHKSEEQYHRILHTISQNLRTWRIKVLKIKAIYHTLNMFHTESQNYVAECWLPTSEISTVQMVLNRAQENTGYSVPSIIHQIPSAEMPTYHKTNKFTEAFQAVIDAYGVATYKEVNPTPFSIISFPFLFGVMFGDAGHAVILLMFALWLVLREKQLKAMALESEIFAIVYGGRYLIMLMAIFSIYTGLIYNDVFSKSVALFGKSKWNVIYDNNTLATQPVLMLDPNDTRVWDHEAYPFGIDPIWAMAENKITFTNSFKKKISIIFGVSQMFLGVMLSLFNHTYFKRWLNIFCLFIPQVIFLLSIFGYLVGLIFCKWILFSTSGREPPNLLIGFINMFMMKYDPGPNVWYPGQKELQICLVLLAVGSAIFMLTAKPLILYCRHKSRSHHSLVLEVYDEDGVVHESSEGTSEPQTIQEGQHLVTDIPPPVQESSFDLGQEFIHQAIHTIEYCLGCISNTASYLRLWALSLAHAQLSEVLWNMVMQPGLTMANPWIRLGILFVAFVPFAFLTVSILLLMEGLSAFLHCLRLHWVEFNNKFYEGDGLRFAPFNFNDIVAGKTED